MSNEKYGNTDADTTINVRAELLKKTEKKKEFKKRKTIVNENEMIQANKSNQYNMEKEVIETQFSNILIICSKT